MIGIFVVCRIGIFLGRFGILGGKEWRDSVRVIFVNFVVFVKDDYIFWGI